MRETEHKYGNMPEFLTPWTSPSLDLLVNFIHMALGIVWPLQYDPTHLALGSNWRTAGTLSPTLVVTPDVLLKILFVLVTLITTRMKRALQLLVVPSQMTIELIILLKSL